MNYRVPHVVHVVVCGVCVECCRRLRRAVGCAWPRAWPMCCFNIVLVAVVCLLQHNTVQYSTAVSYERQVPAPPPASHILTSHLVHLSSCSPCRVHRTFAPAPNHPPTGLGLIPFSPRHRSTATAAGAARTRTTGARIPTTATATAMPGRGASGLLPGRRAKCSPGSWRTARGSSCLQGMYVPSYFVPYLSKVYVLSCWS